MRICEIYHQKEVIMKESITQDKCPHKSELVGLSAGEDTVQAICPDCNRWWIVKLNKNTTTWRYSRL